MTDGSKYEGQFTKGLKNGKGKYTFADGRIEEEGVWTDDKFTPLEEISWMFLGHLVKLFFLGGGLYMTYLFAVWKASQQPELFEKMITPPKHIFSYDEDF